MPKREDAIEKEWRTVPTDLAGWAMRATQMKRERDAALSAIADLKVYLDGAPIQDIWEAADGGED